MRNILPSLALTTLGVSSAADALATRQAKGLNWRSCPELNANVTRINRVQGTPLECANLDVPLDYTNPESESLQLDLFRVTATAEPVLGTVLINFGGPGGEGATNLAVLAEQARANIGDQWNILSWDPRGTGYTIPFRCSLTGATGAVAPTKRDFEGTLIGINITEVFLSGGWDAAGAIADLCYSQANETGSLIGTAFVARDMIQIVDALDEDGLLRFYGWSYGTALGAYVAAMFPERVERMVLDANINPHDYQAGHYGEVLEDTDEAFAGFLDTCFNVTDQCALYNLIQPNSTQDLLDAINLALAPFAQNVTSGIEAYMTYMGVKSTFVQPLYFPQTWPEFAETIAGLLNGTAGPPAAPAEVYGEAEMALLGIRGSDATFIANSSDEYLSQVEFQSTVSPGFSDTVYFSLWASARWRMPAKERYWGDFNVQTKAPILFVNGEFDPATPLVNAYNASATFEGSAVLPHSGYGHGIFVNPSECVAGHIRAYFQNATLPPDDTRCAPDLSIAELWLASSTAAGNETGNNSSGNGNSSSTTPAEASGAAGVEYVRSTLVLVVCFVLAAMYVV